MEKRLAEVLLASRDEIAQVWAERIQQSSERYRRRPLEEIRAVGERFIEALAEAVTLGNYEEVRACLESVVESRWALGFEPVEVQRAVLMGCEAIFPTLEETFRGDARYLVFSVTQVERAIHRSINLLNEAFHERQVRGMAGDVEDALAQRAVVERRLQAVLSGLGHGAVVVNPHLVVLWADERAHSARCGALAPGEVEPAGEQYPEGSLLQRAAETGEVQRTAPGDECSVWLAIPVKDERGEVAEVIGVMGKGE